MYILAPPIDTPPGYKESSRCVPIPPSPAPTRSPAWPAITACSRCARRSRRLRASATWTSISGRGGWASRARASATRRSVPPSARPATRSPHDPGGPKPRDLRGRPRGALRPGRGCGSPHRSRRARRRARHRPLERPLEGDEGHGPRAGSRPGGRRERPSPRARGRGAAPRRRPRAALPHRRRGRPPRAPVRRRAHQAHAPDRRPPGPHRVPARAPGDGGRRHVVHAPAPARRRLLPRVRGLRPRRPPDHARRRSAGRRRRRLQRPACVPAGRDQRRRLRRAPRCRYCPAGSGEHPALHRDQGRPVRGSRALPRGRRSPRRAPRGRSRLPARPPRRARQRGLDRLHGDLPERRPLPALPPVPGRRARADRRLHRGGEVAMTPVTEQVELPITGMTCASCANRIERKLNKLDGVSATVNYATEKGTVAFDPRAVAPDRLVETVQAAGYAAALPSPEPQREEPTEADDTAPVRRRLVASALLTVPVLVISMIPALQFDYWQWLVLQLVTPVVLWGAWPFHRAAWANAKHATATMDTLVSVGVLAAWLWSLYALFLGDAGMTGMTMTLDLLPSASGGAENIYLETAAAVTTFTLAGRYFEARAKRSAGAALRALLELGAKEVSILDDDGRERRIPVEELKVGDRFVVRPGEKVATDGVVEQGTSAVDQSLLTGESVPAENHLGDDVAGARSALRRRRRCWWAPVAAPRSASSSRGRRSSSPRAGSTRSCSTRRVRSRLAGWRWSRLPP